MGKIEFWGRTGNEHADGVGKIATEVVSLNNSGKEGHAVEKCNDWRKKWR